MLKEAWISDETWILIAEEKVLYRKRQNATDVQNQSTLYQEYKAKDRQVKDSAWRDKCAWLKKKQANKAEAMAAHNTMQAVYQIAIRIRGNTNENPDTIKSKRVNCYQKVRTRSQDEQRGPK